MNIYDKKQIIYGKSTKKDKLVKFMPKFEIICLFKYDFVLILFHHAATNRKLDGYFMEKSVIHFFLALLACCQSSLGFLACHPIFFKPVKHNPSKCDGS